MSEFSVIGVEGLDVRVPQVELSWEIFSFTHSCFGFATLHSHRSVSCPASSPWPQQCVPGAAPGSGIPQVTVPSRGHCGKGNGAQLLDRALGEAALDKGLKVKTLLLVQVILTRALAA